MIINPLSNFGDDENDRMSWQQDEYSEADRLRDAKKEGTKMTNTDLFSCVVCGARLLEERQFCANHEPSWVPPSGASEAERLALPLHDLLDSLGVCGVNGRHRAWNRIVEMAAALIAATSEA